VLARESMAFYRDVVERLQPAVDPVFRACGYLFLAHSPSAFRQLETNVGLQKRLGIPSRAVSPAEAAELVQGLDPSSVTGASFCAEDGYFDRPQSVVEAFAAAAARAGVEIVPEEVVSITSQRGGWSLRLDAAQASDADLVVVATGYDTPPLLSPLGLEPPIEKEVRYVFYSEPIRERLLEPLVVSPERRFAAKQLGNGRVLASDLGARGSPEDHEQAWRDHVRTEIRRLVPILEYVSFPILVEGFYDVTPDHQPILGRVPGLDGLWLAAGFSGHGFMIAPAVGRRLAAAIAGEPDDPVLRTLALDRFERGALVPEPQIV
jgi:sarcosine oxidase, subunit beta